jgi:CRISPR-associated helicase Cas3/CRISPR-associated endonuclease Cas3-HD
MDARIERDEPVLQTVCSERLQADWKEILACLRYDAVMHDIGKATEIWQEQEHERIRSKSNNLLITHAVPSAFITAAALQLNSSMVDTPKHAAALAILGHHGQLHTRSAAMDSNQPMALMAEGWQELSELAVQASGLKMRPYPTAEAKSFPLKFMGKQLCEWKAHLPQRDVQSLRFKALYCLMVSLLRTCDSMASKFADGKASEVHPGGAFINKSDVNEQLRLYEWRQVLETDVLRGREPHRIQQRASELNDLCDLLNAGCGEGKTAFALRHFQNLMRQGKVNRIIFTLPTKFTSNNMHRDFRHEYGIPEKLVGIFHSDSLAFLKQETSGDDQEKSNAGELQQQDKVYHRPITISTVDHLLMSFYHGYKFSDWAFGNIMQSLVVFDELHHYETLTVSAINEALKVLRLLRVPHLIMTATIPKTRIAVFNHRLPGDPPDLYKPLVSDGKEEKPASGTAELRIKASFFFRKDNERMIQPVQDDKKIRYEVAPSLLGDLLKHQHLRQIVFVNQVEKAKAIARAIKEAEGLAENCPVICYHAEFIGRDRRRKEDEIRKAFAKEHHKPCILVATQIAELSLDISADRMHTEIAPLDDIAQRGGRLNRNGVVPYFSNEQPYEMIVHALEFNDKYDILPYVKIDKPTAESADEPHLLQRSWDILPDGAIYSFDNVREWVNELYSAHDSLAHANFRQAVHEDAIFGSKPQERYSDKGEEDEGHVVLRTKEYETFDVVPEVFINDLSDSSEVNRDFLLKINERKFWKAKAQHLIEEQVVSILVSKRGRNSPEHEMRRYLTLKRHYDYESGVDFTGEVEFPVDDWAALSTLQVQKTVEKRNFL